MVIFGGLREERADKVTPTDPKRGSSDIYSHCFIKFLVKL